LSTLETEADNKSSHIYF